MALSFLRFIIPQDKKFFVLFDKAALNLQEAAKIMYKLVTTIDPDERRYCFIEIEKLEHIGDEITHEIFYELSRNFITPFDREDIHRLVSAIDDILDYIHGSSKRINIYKVKECSPEMIKLSELLQTQTEELRRVIFELKNMDKLRNVSESLVLINSIENHADDVFDSAVARLFDNEKDPIQIIKQKEILAALETATDMCEDAANVIDSILIKMA